MIVQGHGFSFYKIIGKKECTICDKCDINEIKMRIQENQAHEKDR